MSRSRAGEVSVLADDLKSAPAAGGRHEVAHRSTMPENVPQTAKPFRGA
jgi:hypothetical protein